MEGGIRRINVQIIILLFFLLFFFLPMSAFFLSFILLYSSSLSSFSWDSSLYQWNFKFPYLFTFFTSPLPLSILRAATICCIRIQWDLFRLFPAISDCPRSFWGAAAWWHHCKFRCFRTSSAVTEPRALGVGPRGGKGVSWPVSLEIILKVLKLHLD